MQVDDQLAAMRDDVSQVEKKGKSFAEEIGRLKESVRSNGAQITALQELYNGILNKNPNFLGVQEAMRNAGHAVQEVAKLGEYVNSYVNERRLGDQLAAEKQQTIADDVVLLKRQVEHLAKKMNSNDLPDPVKARKGFFCASLLAAATTGFVIVFAIFG
jgi:hypothetical protein